MLSTAVNCIIFIAWPKSINSQGRRLIISRSVRGLAIVVFKGMTLQQYIRGVNEFYQTIEDNRDCSRSNEKVEDGSKPRTKTELEEYPSFVFRPDNPSPINHSPLNKSVKLSTNRTIDPSSSLRLSKLAFPKLKMQNEGIKLEHIDPIHSKLHIIRPNKQQENAKSLSKDYKPKKKTYHHHSKAKEIPVPLNLKH